MMKKKIARGIVLTLLLIGALTLAFNVQPAKADRTWTETIYIRADGSVEPDTAPISTVDNITYTLTDNIVGDVPSYSSAIVVERDNIVVNGAGYTVQGTEVIASRGINLTGRSNVTIQNMKIEEFHYGVISWPNNSSSNNILGNNIRNNGWGFWLWRSSYNNISGNNITANKHAGCILNSSNYNSISGNDITNNNDGIDIWVSSNNIVSRNRIMNNSVPHPQWGMGIFVDEFSNYNSISENRITNTRWGVVIEESHNNTVARNNITANREGIRLAEASDNTISGNNITNNRWGITPMFSFNNLIYHNNIMDNTQQVYDYFDSSISVWDDGYPSGGNYWSDQYHGDCADNYSGPNQDIPSSDGIVDTPYVIDENNQDNYPLVEPWTPVPPVEDTEEYIDYVNETIQDLPDEIFGEPEEDVPDAKNDFSDLFDDALENIDEGNYEGAIGKLEMIKERIYEEMIESDEREEIIAMIDELIAYLESLL